MGEAAGSTSLRRASTSRAACKHMPAPPPRSPKQVCASKQSVPEISPPRHRSIASQASYPHCTDTSTSHAPTALPSPAGRLTQRALTGAAGQPPDVRRLPYSGQNSLVDVAWGGVQWGPQPPLLPPAAGIRVNPRPGKHTNSQPGRAGAGPHTARAAHTCYPAPAGCTTLMARRPQGLAGRPSSRARNAWSAGRSRPAGHLKG
jgi:hypothetical protein